jgi:hypothetical protein
MIESILDSITLEISQILPHPPQKETGYETYITLYNIRLYIL